MGAPKALLEYQGRTFLTRLLDAFSSACDTVAVVTAPGSNLDEIGGPDIVVNPAPERGMITSLQCGLAARNADAYLFTPVDYPEVGSSTVAKIASAWRDAPHAAIVPQFAGRHGHPVCISAEVARAILALPSSASARDAIHRYAADTLYLAVDDPGILRDVDTPEDYAALGQRGRP